MRERLVKENKVMLASLPIFQSKKRAFSGLELLCDGSRDAITLSLEDLEDLPQVKLTDDFKCLEGWEVEGVRWEGIRVSSILRKMKLSPEIRWFLFRSGTFTSLMSRRKAMSKTTLLATTMNGKKLSSTHGGPLRLVFKGQTCYESIKCVDQIVGLHRPIKTTAESIANSRISYGRRDTVEKRFDPKSFGNRFLLRTSEL
jgi:DMSO/TMAO reductase YedYZ molybdopterin-dependent catalytic subunit